MLIMRVKLLPHQLISVMSAAHTTKFTNSLKLAKNWRRNINTLYDRLVLITMYYHHRRITCLVPRSDHFRGSPFVPFPHGWHFIIRCDSLSVCLFPSQNILCPFVSVIFHFLYSLIYFKLWQNIFIGFVTLPRVFCCSAHRFHFHICYPVFVLFSNCPSFTPV